MPQKMILFGGVFAVIAFAVWIFCIIDVISTPVDQVRNLPKLVWLLVVVLLVDLGSIAWLVAGRPWAQRPLITGGRPGTPARTPSRPMNPDDDEEFLAGLRARAEEQRRRAREAQDKGDDLGGPAPA